MTEGQHNIGNEFFNTEQNLYLHLSSLPLCTANSP